MTSARSAIRPAARSSPAVRTSASGRPSLATAWTAPGVLALARDDHDPASQAAEGQQRGLARQAEAQHGRELERRQQEGPGRPGDAPAEVGPDAERRGQRVLQNASGQLPPRARRGHHAHAAPIWTTADEAAPGRMDRKPYAGSWRV